MKRPILILGFLLTLVAGCATSHNVNVAPIQVAPIRMTMDVNVNVHETSGDEEDAPDATADAGAEDDARAESERGARAPTGG